MPKNRVPPVCPVNTEVIPPIEKEKEKERIV
jgi:hypothetical protein